MAGLMAAVWAAVILTHYRAEEAELQDARRQTAFLASLFAKHAVAKFGDIDQTLRVLRNIWTERPLQLSVHLKPYGDSMGNAVLQTSVINAQGFLVFSTLGLPDKPLYLGDREHFKVHQASGQDTLFVSRPVLGRVSGEWSIQLTRPILNHGKFAGVMVTSVDPNYFSDFYNETNSQLRSRATLVRDTGEVLIASNAFERYIGTFVKPSPYTDPGAPLRGNFRRASQFDGIENLYSYVRLPAYGLTAVVGYGVDEILAAAHNLQRERTGRALMVTLFTLLMSVLLLRSLQHQEAADQSLLESQHRLQGAHGLALFAKDQRGIAFERRGLDPMAHAGARQLSPGKAFARINLAAGRDVRMGEHARGRNVVAGDQLAAESNHRVDLQIGKMRQACTMARVDDLDSNRQRIDVARAAP